MHEHSIEDRIAGSRETRATLVNYVLACRAVRKRSTRRLLLERLDDDIRVSVDDNGSLKTLVEEIVSACAHYPDGIRKLRNALAYFESASIPMSRLDAWLAQLQAETPMVHSTAHGSTQKIFKQLREEVQAIQDQLINQRKLEFQAEEQRTRIIEDLQRIVTAVEFRTQSATNVSTNALKLATKEAIVELELQRAIESRGLRKLVDSGISQSLIASIVFEAIKLLGPP